MDSVAVFDDLLTGLLAPFESGDVALAICDATEKDLPIIRVNPAFTALTGYPESDVIGRNCRFLQGPGTAPEAVARLRRSIDLGEPALAVLWNYRRDGSPFLNEVILNPVRDHTGRLRYYTGLQREVPPLRTGLARVVSFALLPDGTLRPLSDPDRSPPTWFAEMPQRERRRLAHAAAYVTAAAGASAPRLSINIDMLQPDGQLRSEKLEVFARHDPQCTIFEGMLSDTPQDAALLDRLRLLEAVAASVNDGIIITEAEPLDVPGPRMIYVNEAVTRTSGWSREELIGRSPRIFQGENTDRQEVARIGERLRQWLPVTAQLLNYRRDKSTFWIDLSIVPICDQYGWWTHWVAIQRDETERRADADRIAFQAMHDPLTGLANRRKVYSFFDSQVRSAIDAVGGYGLVHVDLDHFKSINDRFGHAAGDAVLIEAARRMLNCSRPGNLVSRIGGDEFIVLLAEIESEAMLADIAERYRNAVTGVVTWNDQKLAMTASVGAAMCPAHGRTLDELMAASDLALYRAKQQGRGCASVFSPTLHEQAVAARGLGAALGAGLERSEFVAFFQPQLRVADLTVVGLEALARWHHPQRGLLAPGAFLGIAADAGLTAMLDDCVMADAFRAAAGWTARGLRFGRVGVNFSGESFADAQILQRVARRLSEAGLSPDQVSLEVIESVFVDDGLHDVAGKLAAFRQSGVGVDLDDFGTGFASLTHLRRFAIDRIKIDGSFIAGIGCSPGDEVIVTAIIRLAASLGLQCVAEGVETAAQFAFLADLGCDCVQGYLFARPMDESATTDWLLNYEHHRTTFRRMLAR